MFFKTNFKQTGDLYAISEGDYAGCFFVLVKKKPKQCGFLAIPLMENVWGSEEVFDKGVEAGIIEYVERVPKIVRKTVTLKFTDNEKSKQEPAAGLCGEQVL
jgi:hypothetical protein